MILVDTSVWIGHLRSGDARLAELLQRGDVLIHPWVVGELALGSMSQRAQVLRLLRALPRAEQASDAELHGFVEEHRLAGRGIGYVDVGLLAAALLTPAARLWTRDRRLAAMAAELQVAAPGP